MKHTLQLLRLDLSIRLNLTVTKTDFSGNILQPRHPKTISH